MINQSLKRNIYDSFSDQILDMTDWKSWVYDPIMIES